MIGHLLQMMKMHLYRRQFVYEIIISICLKN